VKINKEDHESFLGYIDKILAMITQIESLKILYDAVLKISSKCICEKMKSSVSSVVIPSRLPQLRLASILSCHIQYFEILNPRSKQINQLQIQPDNLQEIINTLLQTPVSIVPFGKTTDGKQSVIKYSDLLDQKYEDSCLLSWAGELGDQDKTNIEDNLKQKDIMNNLLIELKLKDFKKYPPTDYATLKFQILSALIADLTSSIKQIIEFLYHHYRIVNLWFARCIKKFGEADPELATFKKKMSELNDNVSSLWVNFPGIKVIIVEKDHLYSRYSHQNHKVLEDRNKEVFNIIDILKGPVQHFTELESTTIQNISLARSKAEEAASLLAMIYNFRSSLDKIIAQEMMPTSMVGKRILDNVKQLDESLKPSESSKPQPSIAPLLSNSSVFSSASSSRTVTRTPSPQLIKRAAKGQTEKNKENSSEEDIQNLIRYMESISELTESCSAMKVYFDKVCQTRSAIIAKRLREKIECCAKVEESKAIELQIKLQQHANSAHVINPNLFFCDLPIEIDSQKFESYLARIFATPMAPLLTSSRTYTSSSLSTVITYKDLYDGNHQDVPLVLMLNTLGDPNRAGGFGRNQFELVIKELLIYLELDFQQEKKFDYAALKFYLAMDLLLQLVTIIKTTAEYILHHYQITYLWFQMLAHLFNKTPRRNSPIINPATKTVFMKSMQALTAKSDDFWQVFPALQHLTQDLDNRKIYDTYTYQKHDLLEGKNYGLSKKLLVIESVLEIIHQWHLRFEQNAELIPVESDTEATTLLLLLIALKSTIKNDIWFLVSKIDNSSTLIVKKLEEQNRQISLEMEETANQKASLPPSFLSPAEKIILTHARSKSFSGT
jgi:hypothetical protein